MTDSIDVLGVSLNCLTAKEAMLKVMQFMENELVIQLRSCPWMLL